MKKIYRKKKPTTNVRVDVCVQYTEKRRDRTQPNPLSHHHHHRREKAAPGGYRAQTEIHSANLLIQSVPSCSDQKQRPYERKTLLCVLQIVVVHSIISGITSELHDGCIGRDDEGSLSGPASPNGLNPLGVYSCSTWSLRKTDYKVALLMVPIGTHMFCYAVSSVEVLFCHHIMIRNIIVGISFIWKSPQLLSLSI